MLKPEQLFIIIYVNVKRVMLTKETITSCSVTDKFRKVNFRPMIEFAMIELAI
jgi:hypothetical protein